MIESEKLRIAIVFCKFYYPRLRLGIGQEACQQFFNLEDIDLEHKTFLQTTKPNIDSTIAKLNKYSQITKFDDFETLCTCIAYFSLADEMDDYEDRLKDLFTTHGIDINYYVKKYGELNFVEPYFKELRVKLPNYQDKINEFYNLFSIKYLSIQTLNKLQKSHPKSGCFIATACYENCEAKEVRMFRYFRDTYLVKHKSGRNFINFYYVISPTIADFISKSYILRISIKSLVLNPIYVILNNYLDKK